MPVTLRVSYDYTLLITGTPAPVEDPWNCDCDCPYEFKTLAQLRSDLMIALGYAAQKNNPGPGMVDFLDFHINQAQALVLSDIEEIIHSRYFSWDLEPGVRFYGLDEQRTDACGRLLRGVKVQEVYLADASGNVITRLRKGIDPILYNGGIASSQPTRYEQRQCIEVWPAPSEVGSKLVVRGLFKHTPMVDPTDRSTADPMAITLRAIAFAKAAKGHQDGGNYMSQYGQYLASLNSDAHNDERYVPGTGFRDPAFCERLTHVMEPRIYDDGSHS